MKEIFAFLLILSVVNADPFLGALHNGPLGKLLQPAERWIHSLRPSGPSCGPPGHSFIPPGHRFTPPGHAKRHLFPFNANQQNNAVEISCSTACICRNPETDDITIIESDGSQIIIKKATQQDEMPNQGEIPDSQSPNNEEGLNKVDSNNIKPNSKNDNRNDINVNKGNPGTAPAYTPTQQPVTAESPRYHGGEGVIDIRMAD